MNDETKTGWFAAAERHPTRFGWYEIESIGWRTRSMYWQDGWHAWIPKWPGDGLCFLGINPSDRWRGLEQPPRVSVNGAFQNRHGPAIVGKSAFRDLALKEFKAGWNACAAAAPYERS